VCKVRLEGFLGILCLFIPDWKGKEGCWRDLFGLVWDIVAWDVGRVVVRVDCLYHHILVPCMINSVLITNVVHCMKRNVLRSNNPGISSPNQAVGC